VTSSISQATTSLTTDYQRPTTSAEVVAERLCKALANGGIYEDPSLGEATISHVPEPLISQPEFRERQIVHYNEAWRAMDVIEKELGKLDAKIAKQRPDLAGSHWDFTLVDGKFKVSGLDADDAKWVESRLNGNDRLLDAAQAFISTAVAELETTAETPAHVDYNYLSRRMETYDFSNVAEQLSEKLSFRELFRDADLIVDSKQIAVNGPTRGMCGLNVATKRLTSNSRAPLHQPNMFYPTSYGV
jgi:hypothetical protein